LTPNADGRIVNSTDGRQETRLNPIAFNELNEVAFLAQIAGTDGRTEAQSGIFSGNGHELREIARTGQNAPDRGVFIDLDPPQINNRGEVLFGAQADPVTGANWPNGLFLATEDGVQAIVRAGDPLPSGESFFTEFRWPQLTDWGVVFLGRRSSDSADAVSYGLYAWNGTSIIEIASARQQLDGSTVVGLSAITRSGGYGVNERGQVAYSVTLPGQRTVLAIWSIPIPEPTAALLAGQLLALTAMRRIRDRHRR
jgi:hypothetical protein